MRSWFFIWLFSLLSLHNCISFRRADLKINSCESSAVKFQDVDGSLDINSHCSDPVTTIAVQNCENDEVNGLYEENGKFGGISRFENVFPNGTKIVLRRYAMETAKFKFVWELSRKNVTLYVSFDVDDKKYPSEGPWFLYSKDALLRSELTTAKVHFKRNKKIAVTHTTVAEITKHDTVTDDNQQDLNRYSSQQSLNRILAESLEIADMDTGLDTILHPAVGPGLGRLLHDQYINADPYPAIVIDNLFNETVLRGVATAVRLAEASEWVGPENDVACCKDKYRLPFTSKGFRSNRWCALLAAVVADSKFIGFIEALTGIQNLVPMVNKNVAQLGSSIIGIKNNGFLYVHNDFDSFGTYHRRVNALLYLNEGWNPDWQGHIELWNTNATQARHRVQPLFNRLVIFTVSDDAFHGHPEPLAAPPGVMRIGFQLVLFTQEAPTYRERFARVFDIQNATNSDVEAPPNSLVYEFSSAAVEMDGEVVAKKFDLHFEPAFSLVDPDWYQRKIYRSPHSAVFQIPCNALSQKFCATFSMPLPEKKHCECNFDSIIEDS